MEFFPGNGNRLARRESIDGHGQRFIAVFDIYEANIDVLLHVVVALGEPGGDFIEETTRLRRNVYVGGFLHLDITCSPE